MRTGYAVLLSLGVCCVGACGVEPPGDLPVGHVESTDDCGKCDGPSPTWGWALECKPKLDIDRAIARPKITISIAKPLTLRLEDLDSEWSKDYPIGVGVLKNGVSRTWEPVFFTGSRDFVIEQQWAKRCRTYWYGKDGKVIPYYAGLPHLSFHPPYYAIHGPIDDFKQEDGGTLNPDYVSHGCVRMSADGIRDLYYRIEAAVKQQPVAVHLTDEPLRAPHRWIAEPCDGDSDCSDIPHGTCRKTGSEEGGWCSATCDAEAPYCPDSPGQPTTFCIADPANDGLGLCTIRAESPEGCPTGFAFAAKEPRFSQSWVKRDVCKPTGDQR